MYSDKLADIAGALNIMLDHSKVVDKYFDYFNVDYKPNSHILRVGTIGSNGVKYPPIVKVDSRCIIFSDALMSRPNPLGAEFIIEFRHDHSTHTGIYRYQSEEIGKMINEISDFLLNNTLPAVPF